MFSGNIQPNIVSLFSSTGSQPLSLFSVEVDSALPSDSFVHLLNDATSLPAPSVPASLISLPRTFNDEYADDLCSGKHIRQTVLHIQSPTLRTTFIQSPSTLSPRVGDKGLGLKHTWLQIQVRNLGREWSFEVGIADKAGRHGVIRCSTFQVVRNYGSVPLLHLPFAFPSSLSNPLTPWSTVTLHLPKFIPYFVSVCRGQRSQDDGCDDNVTAPSLPFLPGGTYSHLTYVKIYATCRLRRIWLSSCVPSAEAPIPWEFELYGD
ncbi:hypothetical protein J3A83DRAFT_4457667 [Scleroderma citrinum]